MQKNAEMLDYFVYSRRPVPMIIDVNVNETEAKPGNLGDWISYVTYGVFDGEEFKILKHGDTMNAQSTQE